MEIKYFSEQDTNEGTDLIEINLDESLTVSAEEYSGFYQEFHELLNKYRKD